MLKKISFILVYLFLFLGILREWIVNASTYSDISTSVSNKFQDLKMIKIAEQVGIQYINTFSWVFDDWKNNNPHLIGDPIPFYADDETYPVALEWKVFCLKNKDCGRVIISVDKKDPIVIEAATEGKTNYETLANGRENKKNRFYYFSPFEQYIDTTENEEEDIIAISPWENMTKSITRNDIQEKQNKNKEARRQKKQLTDNGSLWYSQTGATVVNVPNANNGATCTSPIPCYNQFSSNYNGTICAVGCWPTALTQILAYYDRRWTFPNLFPNIVASPTVMDQTTANAIRTYMGTVCSNGEWATWFSSEGNGLIYARDKGYTNTVLPSLITSNIFYNIRTNVNQWRPVIINASSASAWHIFVAYGWNTDTVWVNQIHVNYGWGPGTPDAWITETSIPALPWMSVRSILPVVITP